jgi:hypothetical protein
VTKKNDDTNICWIHSRLYALEEVIQFHVTQAYYILALTNIMKMMMMMMMMMMMTTTTMMMMIMWNLICTIIPVIVGTPGIVMRSLRKNLEDIPGKHSIVSLQKTAILGTSHIIRKVLQCET